MDALGAFRDREEEARLGDQVPFLLRFCSTTRASTPSRS
jgi:hypothetical protein